MSSPAQRVILDRVVARLIRESERSKTFLDPRRASGLKFALETITEEIERYAAEAGARPS